MSRSKASKSKDKPMQIQVEANQKPEVKCTVCRIKIQPEAPRLTCSECKKIAHTSCYCSDLLNLKGPFTCDMCKKKKKKAVCSICEMNLDKELGKNYEGGDGFVHVECAILSHGLEVESYSKLEFIKKQAQRANKQNCFECKNKKPGPFVNCTVCAKKNHFRCVIFNSQVFTELDYYFLYQLLDKCQKYDFLLHSLIKKKQFLKELVEFTNKPIRENAIIICPQDCPNKYNFCPCCDQIKQNFTACDKCDRWYHNQCIGLPPEGTIGQYICQGCQKNDLFVREVKFNQLISELSKIQKSPNKLTDKDIRLLNALAFKPSRILQRKIADSSKQIEAYFIKRQITRLLSQNLAQNKNLKKITQLLFALAYGDQWKKIQSEYNKNPQDNDEIIANIEKIKKQHFLKQAFQKFNDPLLNDKQANKKNKQYQPLRVLLKAFIKKWKSFNISKLDNACFDLAFDLKGLQDKFIDMFQETKQDNKIFLQKFGQTMGNNIFSYFISKRFSVQTIKYILNKLAKIKYYISNKTEIDEQEYFELLSPKDNISQLEKPILKQVFESMTQSLNKVHIAFKSIKKQQKLRSYQKSIRENPQNFKHFQKLEFKMQDEGVCYTSSDNAFINMRLKIIERNAIKKKLMKKCNIKDHELMEQHFRDSIILKDLIMRKNIPLSQTQKQQVNSYIGKLQFIISILRRGEPLQYLIPDQSQNNSSINPCIPAEVNHINQTEKQPSKIYGKLFHILQNWNEQLLPIDFIINQIETKIVAFNVRFSLTTIQNKLKDFVRMITRRFQSVVFGAEGDRDRRKVSSVLLRKYAKVLKYFGLQSEFPLTIDLMVKFTKWIQIVPIEEGKINLGTYLQKPQKCFNLNKIIENKITMMGQLQRVSLYSQLSKLYLLRQWCKLSQKLSLLIKSKATINAVQTLKNLVDKSMYPINNLSSKVSDLDRQSKMLNTEIMRFLEKPKAPDHSTFFSELKYISRKMTLEEGYTLKTLLDKCNLDVYVQNQELENQIKQFEAVPKDLVDYVQKKNQADVALLRRRMVDSCFRVNRIQDYEGFLRKIYINRCLNFEPPTTRQQYFELIAVGGNAALSLQQKTTSLLHAYQILQKAQAELANTGNRRRNFTNLIPWSDQRYKQLKQDLQAYDPIQLAKLEKAHLYNMKIRQQYMFLRNKKSELQKYKQIQTELSHSIFNNRELLMQINRVKADATMLVKRIEDIIPYSSPHMQLLSHQNIFKRDMIVAELFNCKIRHPTLDKFEYDYRQYIRSQQIRSELTLENYRHYVECFNKMSEPACRIPQILSARATEWQIMYKSAIEMERQVQNINNLHLYSLLVNEGLQLKKLDCPQKDRIFDMVFKIYERIRAEELQESPQEYQQIQEDDEMGENQGNVDNNRGEQRPRRRIEGQDSEDEINDENQGSYDNDNDVDDDQEEDDDQDIDMDDNMGMDQDHQSSDNDKPNGPKPIDHIVLDSD